MYVPEVSARYSRSLLCSVRKYPGSAAAKSARKRSGLSVFSIRSWVRSTPAWLVCATASLRIDTMPAEFFVIVNQDKNENGNAQADEQQRHDQAQSRPPYRDKPRKRAQSCHRAPQSAATSVRDEYRNRQSGRHEQQCNQPAPLAAVISVPDQCGGQRI